MKKLLLILGCLPLFAIAQENSKPFKLSGKVKNVAYQPDWVFLQYRSNGEWKTDSIQSKDGKYSFTGKIEEPVLGRLRVKYKLDDRGMKVATVQNRDNAEIFLQPGKIKITSVDSFSNTIVKGTAAHTEYEKIKTQSKLYRDMLTPLYTKYSEYAKDNDKANQAKTEEEIDAVNAAMKEKVYGDYIRNNPSSPIAVYVLNQYAGWDIDADKADPLFNLLSEKNKNYPSAVTLKENIEIAKKTGIGKMAMNFTQNDTLDIPVQLASFKGKYVLVDFWASWCGPCRTENPNLVKVYNKYKDQNFHIIGVSLDRAGQKEKWLKAIHDDGLAWTQVSDLKFWDNEVAKQYGIKAIPQNLLINPEGIIIAKNIRGEELEEKVASAITEKKAF